MFWKANGTLNRQLQRFANDQTGATTIEYGLIVALISVVLLITLTAIGESIRDDVFGAVVSALGSSTPSE